ncbi:MAG: hypothetical protein JRH01_26635, partial [Deltaproteobacteria bacterium]|nr:hypothetical protein [Deltaproteobacteria bacterium]
MEHEAESATASSIPLSGSAYEQAEEEGVRLARPWFHRLYLAVPLPSAVTASLLLLLCGSLVLTPMWLGWPETYWVSSSSEVSLIVTLLFVYTTWVSYLTHQHNARDHLDHLEDLASDPDVYRAEIFRTTHFRPGVLRIGLLGPTAPLLGGLAIGRTQA